jgi:hypothetical protein
MPIDEYLMRDEEILATVQGPNVTFYATSKRVIRHEKGLFKESVDTIPFSHITHVTLESKSYWWLAVIGVMSIIIGGFVGGGIGLGLVLIGILLVVAGIFAKSSWYQIRSTGMSNNELRRWRLGSARSPDVKTFARMIEDQITKGR